MARQIPSQATGLTRPDMTRNKPSNMQQPLALGSFRNWLKLLWANGGVERKFLPRACFVSTVSLLTAPLRAYERLAYRGVLKNLPLEKPPIFILGHWRSGTTPLHQLLCRDPGMSYVSTFQTIAPEWFLTGNKYFKKLVALAVPTTRMMDNMSLSLDDPQEEEFAVAETSPYSFYNHWSFPRKARDYFEKYALFRNTPDSVVGEWKKIYLNVLRKASLNHQHQQLLIKNPANSSRIKILLELFPDAKFIHIYRNPYTVLVSTRHFFRSVLAITQLQTIGDEELDENILWFYQALMQKFFAEKELIPPENFIEIRFEDFEKEPLAEVRRIYETLHLPGYADAEPAFCEHVTSLKGYQKNCYEMAAEDIEKVQKHWKFTVDRWGYTPPA